MFRAVSGACIIVLLVLCLAGLQLAAGHSPVRTQHATGRYRSLQRAGAQQTAQDVEAMGLVQQFAAEELRHRQRRRLQQVAPCPVMNARI
jgi:enoyl-CoA hydratase/carnithine racemase